MTVTHPNICVHFDNICYEAFKLVFLILENRETFTASHVKSSTVQRTDYINKRPENSPCL